MIAIGGGGYVPARILRSFLKREGGPNIPIQAIGLSLYESLPEITGSVEVEVPGTRVTRTQWLDMSALGQMENLVGKNILIVDEVDDTRTTLEYAVKELEKDIEAARVRMGGTEKTKFSIFVLHVSHMRIPFSLPARRPRNTGSPDPATEQGQGEEGQDPRRHDDRGPLPRGAHSGRRLDLLPLGGHRHRRARPPCRRGCRQEERQPGCRVGGQRSMRQRIDLFFIFFGLFFFE